MNEQERLDRLKYALQALALPAEDQLQLLPEFECKACYLAQQIRIWSPEIRSVLSADRIQSIKALLEKTDEVRNQSELQTDEALLSDPRWQSIRDSAQKTLKAYGWNSEKPLHDYQPTSMCLRGHSEANSTYLSIDRDGGTHVEYYDTSEYDLVDEPTILFIIGPGHREKLVEALKTAMIQENILSPDTLLLQLIYERFEFFYQLRDWLFANSIPFEAWY